ncbi:G-protein beta WD-40 repeats containing protein, putative [Metarhizium acridum CQMa 102]|uniref:G-protein beta WD-40 repeats containing protein, putative n=1 Tax=Metarhizium acridum (strain CQMa 102) TaxID=655827 RepID=E9E808_METAQ|nr:G-protein beta WD-40 repeats containing protein, putative [Metarhizium acridum CQMa 102]EFY88015.1 G-protein beta WD-40 repeats containing protein, putative [Metarhizium acridum CQMa 102]
MSAPTTHHQKIKPGDVTVAIFVALVLESVAVVLSFDEEFHCHTKGAKYVYRFGRIGQHCVVVAQPNDMGKVNASNISAHVTNVFPNVRLALMVGIGGGIPGGEKDIRLGDVVVSKPEDGLPGVLEYDFVRVEGDGRLVRKGTLDKPHPTLLSAVNYIEGEEIMDRSSLPENLDYIIRKSAKFQHPGKADVLYDITFRHVGGKDCTACEDCPNKRIVQRPLRQQRGPKVFHGLIMSGDSVVKDPYERLRLCDGYDKALCFEMEAAGIMDESPCLVVRGICDYCDTHKQGDWQSAGGAFGADEGDVASPWTNDIDGETFFLLHGPAGTGKSTIARSIANQLATDPTMTTKLGASYFFNTSSSKLFFPTIAARLMHSIPELKQHLWNSLEYCGWFSKAEIEGKDREKQLQTLILNPIRYLSEQSSEKWSRVIVVDALDKCEKEHILTICTLLSRLHGLDAVRFRIFLTSRSQGTIMERFHKLEKEHMARSLSILKYPSETKADIAKVLEADFADVKKRKNIREDWPEPEDLNHLVELATTPSPLFIYAATVCRYVDNAMISTNPVWRLRHWLDKFKNASRFDERFDKKFDRGLDQQFNDMYKEVLKEATGRLQVHEREILEDVLCSILVLFTPLPSKCLAALLGKNDRDVDCLLPNLYATQRAYFKWMP